jgi:uncharacterized damage-inducible protein DinB
MSSIPPERGLDAVDGCVEACRRCEAVILSILEQNAAAYAAVGPHLRHCLDHFKLFLDGWSDGGVDYDARPRDPRTERDPGIVRGLLRDIIAGLTAIGEEDLGRELKVTQSVAPGRPPLASRSRVERELAFLSSHTIHHIAIMVLAARAAGVEVPADLAVAYATDAHRASLVKA